MAGIEITSLRLQLNHRGIADILSGPEVAAMIASRTAAVKAQAGSGFRHETKTSYRHGSLRATGMVWAATAEAQQREAEDKALTRAIGAS